MSVVRVWWVVLVLVGTVGCDAAGKPADRTPFGLITGPTPLADADVDGLPDVEE